MSHDCRHPNGWEHHSVNMNRILLASPHATTVKATKICNSQGLTDETQTSFMSQIWPTSCHRIIGGRFFFFDFRAKTADSSCCFCFLCSLTCPLPPGFVLKNCNCPVDVQSQFLCALQYFPPKLESQATGYLETWPSFTQHGTQNPCSPGLTLTWTELCTQLVWQLWSLECRMKGKG